MYNFRMCTQGKELGISQILIRPFSVNDNMAIFECNCMVGNQAYVNLQEVVWKVTGFTNF